MHPVLFGNVSVYFLMWGLAAVACVTFAVIWAGRAGLPIVPALGAAVLLTVSILLGSKLLYLIERLAFPLDDYVPEYGRGMLHGFRIPGGILALTVAVPIAGKLFGLPWRRFGDTIIPWVALSVVFIRLGCFLNGCCFGTVSSLPWAIRFPPGSWVFWYHLDQHWIPINAQESLPVHPLQLYFLLAAAATFLLLLALQRRQQPAGRLQLLYYVLFFGSTALLEPLRQNPLTLNGWLTGTVALVCGGWFLWTSWAHWQAGAKRAVVAR